MEVVVRTLIYLFQGAYLDNLSC